MKCPRCETIVLDEKERDGITIDACRQCRGIWLDRGELERLIARAIDEQKPYQRRNDRDDEYDDDDFDSRPHRDAPPPFRSHENRESRDYRSPKKRNWFESLTDLFE